VGLKFTRFQVVSDKGGEIQSTFCSTSENSSTGFLGEENQAKPGYEVTSVTTSKTKKTLRINDKSRFVIYLCLNLNST